MFFPPGKVGQSLQQQMHHAYIWRLDRQLQLMDFGPLLIVTLLLCLAFASLSRSTLCDVIFFPQFLCNVHHASVSILYFIFCLSFCFSFFVYLCEDCCQESCDQKEAGDHKKSVCPEKKTSVKFWWKPGLGNDFLDHRNYTTLTQLPRDPTWQNEKQSLQMSRLHHAATVLRFG